MFLPLKDYNPTERFPIVTIGLIVVNVVVFLYELSLGGDVNRFVAAWGAIPFEITRGVSLGARTADGVVDIGGPPITYMTIFSSMFIHGGFLHIIGNMLYLWIFGNNIEDILGPVKFLVFYLVSGLVAAAAHIITEPNSMTPVIGASGDVSGVLGAYLIAYPHARVLTLVFFFIFIRLMLIPASFLLVFWFIIQAFSGVASLGAGGGGVAWWAHIGGFVAGIGLIKMMAGQRLAWRRARDQGEEDHEWWDR